MSYNKELTKAELLIMKCVWNTSHDMVLSELVEMSNENFGKDWKPQTVSTYLAHLVQKGFLKMTRNGKIYTYHPLVEKNTYFKKAYDDFIEYWGADYVEKMLSN